MDGNKTKGKKIVITLKYNIEKAGKKIGTIEWTDTSKDNWKYETEDKKVLAELDSIRDKGKVTGYTSKRTEDAHFDFIEVDILPTNNTFVDVVGDALGRKLGDDDNGYWVWRTAIIKDGVKIGE